MENKPKTKKKSKTQKQQPEAVNTTQSLQAAEKATLQKTLSPSPERKIIVVLEQAGLDYSRLKKEGELINSEDHQNFIINKLRREPGDYRPDITHQCLLNLLDSPLNKRGLLKVYINTINNIIIEVNSSTRIPRTYHRFSPLMVQLLKKGKIKSPDISESLMKIVDGPISKLLPEDAVKVATSTKGRLVPIKEYIGGINIEKPVVFVVGAVAKGNPTMDVDYIQDAICISKYSMSACYALTRILLAFQDIWQIE